MNNEIKLAFRGFTNASHPSTANPIQTRPPTMVAPTRHASLRPQYYVSSNQSLPLKYDFTAIKIGHPATEIGETFQNTGINFWLALLQNEITSHGCVVVTMVGWPWPGPARLRAQQPRCSPYRWQCIKPLRFHSSMQNIMPSGKCAARNRNHRYSD